MGDSRELIDRLTVSEIRDITGPELLVNVGETIFSLAYSTLASSYNLSLVYDIRTSEPIVNWDRTSSVGRKHHIALTHWSERSYVLYDDMLPDGELGKGAIQTYLFGNDAAIRGISRAAPLQNYEKDTEIKREELEILICGYQRHPSSGAAYLPTSEVKAFCRLLKSIVNTSS